jgi:DHA3 family tetracycline resistance protein-like MFS transporter
VTRSARDPRTIYIAIAMVQAGVLTMGFLLHALYLIDRVHVDPLQLVLVGTVMEATILLCEVPTGIVADLVSRRLSVQIGYAVMASAWLLEAAVPRFGVVLAAQVLVGLGYTFTSGATQAWLAGEIGDDRVRPALLRASQIGKVTAVAAIPVAIGLGALSLRLPLLAAGVLAAALTVVLLRVMPEDGFTRAEQHGRRVHLTMLSTARDGLRAIRARTVLLLMLPVALFLGASSESIDRLWVAHVGGLGLDLTARSAVLTIGVIEGVGLLGGALALRVIRRRVDHADERRLTRMLLALLTLQTVAMFAFGIAGAVVVALPLFLVYDIVRGAQDSVYEAWLVPLVPHEVRATVLSTYGQADAVGQVGGGPLLGLIARQRSTAAAIVAGSAFLLPALASLGALRRRLSGPDVQASEPAGVVDADVDPGVPGAIPFPESR